jgi:hypothetical protein
MMPTGEVDPSLLLFRKNDGLHATPRARVARPTPGRTGRFAPISRSIPPGANVRCQTRRNRSQAGPRPRKSPRHWRSSYPLLARHGARHGDLAAGLGLGAARSNHACAEHDHPHSVATPPSLDLDLGVPDDLLVSPHLVANIAPEPVATCTDGFETERVQPLLHIRHRKHLGDVALQLA